MAVYSVAAITYKRTGGTDTFIGGLRGASLEVQSASEAGAAVSVSSVPWAQAKAGPLSWSVSLDLQPGASGLAALVTAMRAGEVLDIELVLGEARRVSGQAYIASIDRGGAAGGAKGASISIAGKNKLYGWYEASYPAAPTNLAVDSVTSAGVTLSWDQVADVTGYYLYWGTREGGGYPKWKKLVLADLADAANPSYTLSRLTAGRTYYFVATSYTTAS